jgi:hypothetical protein
MVDEKLSICFSHYEPGNDECDKKKCAFRFRCKAFSRFLYFSKKNISEYLIRKNGDLKTKKNFDLFLRFCDQLIKDETEKKIKQKELTIVIEDLEEKKHSIKKITRYKRLIKREKKFLEEFNIFKSHFQNGLKEKKILPRDKIVSPGQLFFKKEVKRFSNVGICLKTKNDQSLPVVVFVFTKRGNLFNVRSCLDINLIKEKTSNEVFRKLKPVEFIKGNFRTKFNNFDRYEAGLFCELLIKLLNENYFDEKE